MKAGGKATVSNRAAGVARFSPKKYGRLLADTLPKVVTDDQEYARLEEVANRLLNKGEDNLAPEEDQLLGLLTNLLEEYEARTLPRLRKVSPAESLRFLMEENRLTQMDLADIFGSQSAVSRALGGSRRIGIEHAKKLARRFRVSAELFI
jgi:HTH-type transcriptional regulator / antitoxin HigA